MSATPRFLRLFHAAYASLAAQLRHEHLKQGRILTLLQVILNQSSRRACSVGSGRCDVKLDPPYPPLRTGIH